MLTAVLPRLAATRGSVRRSTSVIERNVATLRSSYWVGMAIGIGVGALIGDMPLPDGRVISYATFVAPAMLASSAMAGALSETTFNFFGKMKYMKLYDGVLATPVRPFEIALGELAWAMLRGTVYAAAFLGVMVAMDLTSGARALAAFPATVLVGFAFGAVG